MYQRNLKYIKGHGNEDKWEDIPKELYDATIDYFTQYAEKKGFNIPLYMAFIKENIVREV